MTDPSAGDRGETSRPDGWAKEQRSLSGLITVTQRVINSEFHRRMDEAGYADIRPGAGNVFEHIGPEGSTIVTMAQRAGVTSQAMVQVVDYLERGGYIERTPDPSDRRAKLIRFTEPGRSLTSTAAQILRDIEDEARAALGDERLQELRVLLQELVDAVARHDPGVE